jgi:hypothetical protein
MTDQQPPPGPIPTPQPPAETPAEALPPPAPPSKEPSKVRTYITFGVIAVIVAVLAFFISQNARADDLAIGQCFDEPANDTGITTVVKRACTEAHDAEVIHVAEYDQGASYPISLSISSFIDDTCVPVFATYVGQPFEEATEFDLGYFYPDREGWDDGDRTFTCYVMRVDDAKLTQSVKAAGS